MNLAPIRPISEQFSAAQKPLIDTLLGKYAMRPGRFQRLPLLVYPSLALTDKDRKVRDAGMLTILYDRILSHILVTDGLQNAWEEEECLHITVTGGAAYCRAVEYIRQLKTRRNNDKNHPSA